jgi:hypothetical protein
MNVFTVRLLDLRDPGDASRARFTGTMERLTGRPSEEFQALLGKRKPVLFEGLDRTSTERILEALDGAGARTEVIPVQGTAMSPNAPPAATLACPSCGHVQPAGGEECVRCGVVFAKVEREQVQKMQTDSRLEEALQKALQVREEWTQRAKHYLEDHPLAEGAVETFERRLFREEIPFLLLVSEEGPLLMTSRRLLFNLGERQGSVPYELVSDVDLGGGLIQKKRGSERLQLTFKGELPFEGGSAKSLAWNLDKESTFYKDVIMDWCFARNFICGSCGARDLDYRLENDACKARCMHCATDHDVDLVEAVAIPNLRG